MEPVPVELRGLGKRFGARVALEGLDLELGAGEILGLAGPNGSGKTTLLRLLAGLLRPDAGRVRVFGHEPFVRREHVMARARFVFAPPALLEGLSAREHLRHLGSLGAGVRVGRAAIDGALETVGLAERADDRVGAFSFGMRQRLALALALLPRPELLVLDEPTEGLDPLAILELRAVLQRLRTEHGLAILLSSHLLVEIDRLVDRLCVLREGRSLFQGTPAELQAGGERLCLRVDDPARARELLSARGIRVEAREPGLLELEPRALELEPARALLAGAGVRLLEFHHRRVPLEQALLQRLARVEEPA